MDFYYIAVSPAPNQFGMAAIRQTASMQETLVKHSELFMYQHKHFYLIEKSEFTKECVDRANEMGNMSLVSYSDMVRHQM